MKLYALNVNYAFGEITECEVVKETERTYTVKIKGWGDMRILKSSMSTHSYYLCKTLEEAQETLKKVLNSRIARCKANIRKNNEEIEKYNLMLADV